jgi:hypothetical protein
MENNNLSLWCSFNRGFFMHIAIDILAGIILLFFFLSGWHKGFLLSLLGVVRVVLAYGIAYFSGRYIGFWLGEATNRPRLITIPVCAFFAFVLITFIFYIIMHGVRERHRGKETKEDFHRPLFSCFSGGTITLAAGTLSLALLFWLFDLFLVGVAGRSIPVADTSYFGRFARRTVYEASYFVIPKNDNNASQASAMANMISDPAPGMAHLGNALSADSIQQLVTDKQFAEDFMSGDAVRIEQNASLQQVFNDKSTLDELQQLGILSGYENDPAAISQRLASFGQNETIQTSIENLKAKQLLSTDKIKLLVRDRDFDAILCEMIR